MNAPPLPGSASGDAARLCEQGNVCLEAGHFRDAIGHYGRALEIRPGYRAALTNRSNAWRALGETAHAMDDVHSALAIGEFPEGFNNRGNLFRDRGNLAAALADFDCALALRPDFILALSNRGNVLLDLHRNEEALASFAAALKLSPDYGEALFGHASALLRARRDLALSAMQFARAAESGIDPVEALVGQASAYAGLERHAEAAACLRGALELNPQRDFALGSLVYSELSALDWRELEPRSRELRARVSEGKIAAHPHTLLYISDDPRLQLAGARYCAAREAAVVPSAVHPRMPRVPGRIRVAYVSADLRDHAVSRLLIGTLRCHDRSAFEILGVSLRRGGNAPFETLVRDSFDGWLDASELPDEGVAAWLRERETDILVDLMGRTDGARPGILMQRAAPVQVGYLGYAGTSANPALDSIIADAIVIPEGEEHSFTERVVRLPHCFLPNDNQRTIGAGLPRAALRLPIGAFVFCALTHPAKINPAMFEVWIDLLREVPGSVLWLRTLPSTTRANLCREAAARGVDAERLVMLAPIPDMAEYLGTLAHADLFLDTTPYGAHSTACDALWAGVPVLTIMGRSFASRVAASALTAVGLPELITRSLSEYAACALELARDANRLRTLRARLAAARSASPLFDTPGHTRRLESALRELHARADHARR